MNRAEYRLKELQQAAILEMEACSVKKQFTPEKIQEWKELGVPKPLWISDTDWRMGNDLNPRQSLICRASALMMKNDEVASLTGMSPEYVSNVINSEAGKQEIGKIQDQFFSNTKKMLEDILPIAVKTAFEVMLDPKTKPQTKADAAFRFMDRVMGRPVQQVEISDNLLRQVYEKLDIDSNVVDIGSRKIDNAILVSNEEQKESVPETVQELDPADAWVKENL